MEQRAHTPIHSIAFLTLLGVTGLSIADPVLRAFGNTPELFAHFNVDSLGWMVAFAIVVVFLPPVVLWAIVRLVGAWSTRAAHFLGVLVCFCLAFAWGVQLGKWSLALESASFVIVLGMVCGIALLVGIRKSKSFQVLLKLMALVPVLGLLVFLTTSRASSLLLQAQAVDAALVSGGEHPSVLFLLLDEFPTGALLDEAGGIDASAFPNLAALAEQAMWYKNYTVLADGTRLSVPSLLTGTAPSEKPATAQAHPTNLFALLAPTHHLVAYETITSLCAYRQCSEAAPGEVQKPSPQLAGLLARAAGLWLTRVSPWSIRATARDDFQEVLVAVSPGDEKRRQEKTDHQAQLLNPEKMTNYTRAKPARLERFKNAIQPSDTPALYFLHLELPHSPWRFYEDGAVYEAPKSRLAMMRETSNRHEWMITIAEYRFMEQAKYTDRLVGSVIDRLKALSLWEDMLVVVTADHGRSFKLHTDHRRAARNTLDQIAYVPLLVKLPGQSEGRTDSSNLMAYDLLPTIADALSIDMPWSVEGFVPGDRKIRHRANRKDFFFNKATDFFATELDQKRLFSMQNRPPGLVGSQFRNAQGGGRPFDNFFAGLQSVSFIGRPVSGYEAQAGGEVSVEDLERLRRPGNEPPLGLVMGQLPPTVEADELLIAINGMFVTASPVFRFMDVEKTFLAMLPNGSLAQENTLAFFMLKDGELYRLTPRLK